MKWAALLIFGTIGLVALAGGAIQGLEVYPVYRDSVPAQGTVVEVIAENNDASSKVVYFPVVEFSTAGNVKTRSRMRSGSKGSPAYEKGAEVDVLYDPGNPANARIGTVSQLWTGPLVTGGLGIVLLLLSSMLFIKIGRFEKGIKAIGPRK